MIVCCEIRIIFSLYGPRRPVLFRSTHPKVNRLECIPEPLAFDVAARLPPRRTRKRVSANARRIYYPWHFLYLRPLPQGQGLLRPIFWRFPTACIASKG